MNVIHHKTWTDLWHNKGRAAQVALIITSVHKSLAYL